MKNIFLVLITLLFISGCSTLGLPGSNSWSYNPQNYAGCTVTVYEGENQTVTHHDCKDKDSVNVAVDLNSDGNQDFNYDASDVVGSKATAIRAEVEKVFAEKGAQVTPDIVEGVVDAILGL